MAGAHLPAHGVPSATRHSATRHSAIPPVLLLHTADPACSTLPGSRFQARLCAGEPLKGVRLKNNILQAEETVASCVQTLSQVQRVHESHSVQPPESEHRAPYCRSYTANHTVDHTMSLVRANVHTEPSVPLHMAPSRAP